MAWTGWKFAATYSVHSLSSFTQSIHSLTHSLNPFNSLNHACMHALFPFFCPILISTAACVISNQNFAKSMEWNGCDAM